MGQNPSRHEPLNDKLYCSIDMDMQPIEHFKALGCGHVFCIECLEAWKDQKLINCPKCRYEERQSLSNLTDPRYFEGPLYIDQSPEYEDIEEIQTLLHAQMVRRAKTISILLDAAEAVTKIELSAAGVKIGGAVAGLVGTGMVVTGGVLSLTGVGAVAGVPLAMAGAAVGGTGGLVVGGGIIGEMVSKKQELKGANEYLQSDYFHSMQLRILIGRAARNESFAEKLNIPLQDALGFIGLVGRTAKFGLAATNLARAIATGLARGAGTAGLHVAGIAIGAVLIPIDLFQMITNSIKIHKKEKAEIAKDLENIADELRIELFSLLKERQYQLVELERHDEEKRKHCLLLAVEESELEMVGKSNLSLAEVRKEHVVILDEVGSQLDDELYQDIVYKWISSNLLDEDSSENDEDDNDDNDDDDDNDGFQFVGEEDILLEQRC